MRNSGYSRECGKKMPWRAWEFGFRPAGPGSRTSATASVANMSAVFMRPPQPAFGKSPSIG